MKGRLLLALAIFGGLGGCATILHPFVPARMVMVRSTPEGATVMLDGWIVGRTPCSVEVPQSSDGILELRLEGYDARKVVLKQSGFWAVFLDVIPIFFYYIVLVVVHNNDTDKSWRDDFLKAAGFTVGATGGALLVDVATESHRIFPKNIPSIDVTLNRRE